MIIINKKINAPFKFQLGVSDTKYENARHYYHSGEALATTSKPVTAYQIELEEMNKDHNSRGYCQVIS